MVELAFTHLGYFFKSGFREACFCVFGLFFSSVFGAAVPYVLFKLAYFVAFPCLKWCFNKVPQYCASTAGPFSHFQMV